MIVSQQCLSIITIFNNWEKRGSAGGGSRRGERLKRLKGTREQTARMRRAEACSQGSSTETSEKTTIGRSEPEMKASSEH